MKRSSPCRRLITFQVAALAFACLCTNGLAISAADKNGLLVKQTPQIDRPRTHLMLSGRIEQIASATATTKLVLPVTATGLKTKTSLHPESGRLQKLKTTRETVRLSASSDSMSNSAETSNLANTSKRAFLDTFVPSKTTHWGGDLKLVSSQDYKSDPTRSAHINEGETGAVVFRFIGGADGKPLLQPTMIFFAGRDLSFGDSLKQQRFGDAISDGTSDGTQATNKKVRGDMVNFLGPIASFIPGPSERLRFTYVDLGDCHAYNQMGNRFFSQVLKNSVRALSDDAIEEDIVSKVWADGSGTLTAYREAVVRLTRIDDNTAFAKVARVDYAADRTIVRRRLFEGLLSTDCGKAAEQICKFTGMPWQETALKYGL